MRILGIIAATASALALSGCFNMPTQPSQITGAYTSDLKYSDVPCPRLVAEADSLGRRESALVIAQDQRIKSSQVQAFWLGYGSGDGVEASELATVRGEREAVTKAMEIRNCHAKVTANEM
jgi:hypothetical protein